jgi:type IV secretion system protein VirB6
MFTWVGTQFDGVLNTYVLGVVTALMAAITPVALTAATLWVAFYGWAVLRNEVPETIPTFVWKVFKLGLVLAFALQAGFYINNVAATANALATGVATTFLPAAANPATITSPYALLDAFNDRASQLVLDLLKEAGITRLDLMFAAVVCSFGNVAFLCIALFVVTLARLFLTFVIAVGPLFILCLAFRPTQRFFDSWLSMLLNSVVLAWFAFFGLGLSAQIGDALVQAVQLNGGFLGSSFNVVGESLKYCIVMVLMAIICFQAPSLASALTGGAAVQQGIQMVQNVLMVAGLRSAVSSSRMAAAPAAIGGGVIRPTIGQAIQSIGTTVRMPSGRASSGAIRQAAYRLAALRGRASTT